VLTVVNLKVGRVRNGRFEEGGIGGGKNGGLGC